MALRAQANIQHAAFARGGRDRAIEIQLLGRAFAGETAQPAQRNLEIAWAEFGIGIEIAVDALIPDLGRHAPATLRADTDPTRMEAAGSERARTTRANPTVAARVALLLLLKPLAELLNEFFKTTEGFDLRFLLVGQHALHAHAQPVVGDGGKLFRPD